MPRLFCFGLGYSARHLALRLIAEGWTVAGTCRTAEGQAALAAEGIEAYRFDRARPLAHPETILAGTTHLLSSVPPDEAGDPVLDRHGADLVRLDGLSWAGYLSTTSVYGDRAGGQVDEAAERRPTSPRGERRVAAEDGWMALWRTHGVPVHLFRLSGIYGPGRSAIDAMRAGTAKRIDKPGHAFNRIHVDDIAAVLRASIDRPNPGAAYNLADDDPAPSRAVTEYAAALLGMAPPSLVPFAEAGLSPMAISFWADDKRVSNRRIKEELGVRLAHPGYRDGLAAQLAGERAAGKRPAASPL